ncbi:MAG: transcription antitermination factor NusB [Candidatus Bipolaricaulaceae bacterium]
MRRRAREAVLRCLYRREFVRQSAPELLAGERLGGEAEFAGRLLAGVIERQPEIDRIINERAHGWGVDRLAVVDRNILRLGLYEVLYSDTPLEVAIDEAVELAKTYGTERAPAFINGILDRVGKEAGRCAP